MSDFEEPFDLGEIWLKTEMDELKAIAEARPWLSRGVEIMINKLVQDPIWYFDSRAQNEQDRIQLIDKFKEGV